MTQTLQTLGLCHVLIAQRETGSFVVGGFPGLDHALSTASALALYSTAEGVTDPEMGWPEGYEVIVVLIDAEGAASCGWHDVRSDLYPLDRDTSAAYLAEALA
jgi:hypothetical protein